MLCLKCGARVPWEDHEAALGLDFGDDITRLNAAFALAGSVPWAVPVGFHLRSNHRIGNCGAAEPPL